MNNGLADGTMKKVKQEQLAPSLSGGGNQMLAIARDGPGYDIKVIQFSERFKQYYLKRIKDELPYRKAASNCPQTNYGASYVDE